MFDAAFVRVQPDNKATFVNQHTPRGNVILQCQNLADWKDAYLDLVFGLFILIILTNAKLKNSRNLWNHPYWKFSTWKFVADQINTVEGFESIANWNTRMFWKNIFMSFVILAYIKVFYSCSCMGLTCCWWVACLILSRTLSFKHDLNTRDLIIISLYDCDKHFHNMQTKKKRQL